jgi:hypothetical protein
LAYLKDENGKHPTWHTQKINEISPRPYSTESLLDPAEIENAINPHTIKDFRI